MDIDIEDKKSLLHGGIIICRHDSGGGRRVLAVKLEHLKPANQKKQVRRVRDEGIRMTNGVYMLTGDCFALLSVQRN